MPNDQGPHGARNAKKKLIPASVSYRDVIGYTIDPLEPRRAVTVYTTLGHFTQDHPDKWNIGWDSCAGWECKFFGNVPDGSDDSSRGNRMAPDQYVQKLAGISGRHNRFNGLVWDLTTPSEGPGYHRREFWIRGTGRDAQQRFPHHSRGHFVPVADDRGKRALWNQIARWRGKSGAET